MRRFHQALLITSFLPLCWLGMMAVHEAGHVLAAWATGGTPQKVVLHPLAISRTDISPNPEPLIVAWAGPLLGVLLPLLLWAAVYTMQLPGAYLLRFFSGFCLVANGTYIGIGSFELIGDAGALVTYGTPRWVLWLFGAIAIPAGLRLWHGLGCHFGIGENSSVSPGAAYLSLLLLVLLLVAGIGWSPRS